jgi:hypothetical protein
MIRTSLLLPEKLKKQSEEIARQKGVSLASLIRHQLELVIRAAGTSRRDGDPIFAEANALRGRGGTRDLAEKHDDYLYGKVQRR